MLCNIKELESAQCAPICYYLDGIGHCFNNVVVFIRIYFCNDTIYLSQLLFSIRLLQIIRFRSILVF